MPYEFGLFILNENVLFHERPSRTAFATNFSVLEEIIMETISKFGSLATNCTNCHELIRDNSCNSWRRKTKACSCCTELHELPRINSCHSGCLNPILSEALSIVFHQSCPGRPT